MKTNSEARYPEDKHAGSPGPQGIGMAVAFDWGLAGQFLATPVLTLLLKSKGPLQSSNLSLGKSVLLECLIFVPLAAVMVLFGEGIRRGWRITRPIQVVVNSLGFVGGFASAYNLFRASRAGNYWGLVATIILLVFSPLIAWRLSRPSTKRWFESVSSAEARRRHGGAWPWLIAIWAAVGGILQALSTFYR